MDNKLQKYFGWLLMYLGLQKQGISDKMEKVMQVPSDYPGLHPLGLLTCHGGPAAPHLLREGMLFREKSAKRMQDITPKKKKVRHRQSNNKKHGRRSQTDRPQADHHQGCRFRPIAQTRGRPRACGGQRRHQALRADYTLTRHDTACSITPSR